MEQMTHQAIHRNGLEWKQNSSGNWAWFEGASQRSGAYSEFSQADYSFEAHGLCHLNRHVEQKQENFTKHPDFSRLDRVYGYLDEDELREALSRMSRDIEQHHRVARREFNGNGGRRTGAAVSAEAAREIAQERQLLGIYATHKFGSDQ